MTWIKVSATEVINSQHVINIVQYHSTIRFFLSNDEYIDATSENKENADKVFCFLLDSLMDSFSSIDLTDAP